MAVALKDYSSTRKCFCFSFRVQRRLARAWIKCLSPVLLELGLRICRMCQGLTLALFSLSRGDVKGKRVRLVMVLILFVT